MSYETQSLHAFFFFFFVFETPLKDFSSIFLFFSLFGLDTIQTCIKQSWMYLPNKPFFKTSHKIIEKSIFQQSADLNFPFGLYHGATPWSH